MSFSAGALVGVADRMRADAVKRDDIARQDQLRADQEDQADFHVHAEELRKMASDDNVHPAAREQAASAYAQMVGNGRAGMKAKDRAKLLMDVGQAARGYRARQILGLDKAGQEMSSSFSGGANQGNVAPSSQSTLSPRDQGPEQFSSVPTGMMDIITKSMGMAGQQVSQAGQEGAQEASSLPYLLPEERMQQQVRLLKTLTGGASGMGGGYSDSGDDGSSGGSSVGSPRLEPRLGKNGELTFSPVQPSYHFEQMTYVDPRDGQEHEGSISVDLKSPGTAYLVDPQSGKLIQVRPTSKTRSDTVIPVAKVVNGKKVISYERRSRMAGQTIDAPVANHSIIEPGSDGNLHKRTYRPGFNGQPDQLVSDEVVGRDPLLELKQESARTGIDARRQGMEAQRLGMDIRRNDLFSPEQLDYMIQEENNGADMAKVASPVYTQMLKRRNEFAEQGHGDIAALPDRYTAGAQNVMRDATRVINTTDRIRAVIDDYVKENGGVPSKLPYRGALGVLAYRMGFASEDEFNKHLADMSILSLNSAATVGGKGIRNWNYIKMTLQHTPEPGKDSMQLVIDKMEAIKSLNEDLIAAARDTGLKSGVVNIPGSGVGRGKQAVPKGVPSRMPSVQSTRPAMGTGAGTGARDLSKLTDEELLRLATGGH